MRRLIRLSFLASECSPYRLDVLVKSASLEDDPDEYRGHDVIVEVCEKVNCLQKYSGDGATTPWHQHICERDDCLRTSGREGSSISWNEHLVRYLDTGKAYDPVAVFEVRPRLGDSNPYIKLIPGGLVKTKISLAQK